MSDTHITEGPTQSTASDSGDGARILFGAGGLIAVVLGLFVLFAPKATAGAALVFIAALIGIYAIVTGLVYLAVAMLSRSIGGWSRVGHILLGIVYAVGGGIIVTNLMFAGVVTALLFSIMIGAIWIVEGILAFVAVGKAQNKVLTVVYGVLSIIAGVILLISPMLGAATLWWLLGISMLVLGLAQLIRAFRS